MNGKVSEIRTTQGERNVSHSESVALFSLFTVLLKKTKLSSWIKIRNKLWLVGGKPEILDCKCKRGCTNMENLINGGFIKEEEERLCCDCCGLAQLKVSLIRKCDCDGVTFINSLEVVVH